MASLDDFVNSSVAGFTAVAAQRNLDIPPLKDGVEAADLKAEAALADLPNRANLTLANTTLSYDLPEPGLDTALSALTHYEVRVDGFKLVIDTDDTNALLRAAAAMMDNTEFKAGHLVFARRSYVVTGTISFMAYLLAHNLTLRGQGNLATYIDHSGAADGVDLFTFGPGGGFTIQGMTISGCGRHAVNINPGGTPFSTGFCMRGTFFDLRIQFCRGSAIRGVNAFLLTFDQLWLRDNGYRTTPTVSRTGWGLELVGGHTTVSVSTTVYCEGNGLGGVYVNGMAKGTINATCDRNHGPGIYGSNLVSVDFSCYGEENTEALIKLRADGTGLTGLPPEYQDLKGVRIHGCWSWANSHDTPGAYPGFLDIIASNGKVADISLSANYDKALAGTEAVHKSVSCVGTGGGLTLTDLGAGRYGGTTSYVAVTRLNQTTVFIGPDVIVPGDSPLPGGKYFLKTPCNLVILAPVGIIQYYTLVLPKDPKDGDGYTIKNGSSFTVGATTFTVDPTYDGNVPGRTISPTANAALTAGGKVQLVFLAATNRWEVI